MIITIDGPTASGKSTVARILAQKLNYYYLYSGLLFRGLGYILMRDFGYRPEQLSNPRLDDVMNVLNPARFCYEFDAKSGERLLFDGEDITLSLKESSVDQASSVIGTNKHVRDYLLNLQRTIANAHDVVVDGRDAGSTVFPHADFKFFLTATVQERARRWKVVQEHYGKRIALHDAVALIMQRDERDAQRAYAPLQIAPGATVIDSTTLTPEQTIEKIMSYIQY